MWRSKSFKTDIVYNVMRGYWLLSNIERGYRYHLRNLSLPIRSDGEKPLREGSQYSFVPSQKDLTKVL